MNILLSVYKQLSNCDCLYLKQPLQNEELIKDRHRIVECFVDASSARADLYEDHLKRMPDVLVKKKLTR